MTMGIVLVHNCLDETPKLKVGRFGPAFALQRIQTEFDSFARPPAMLAGNLVCRLLLEQKTKCDKPKPHVLTPATPTHGAQLYQPTRTSRCIANPSRDPPPGHTRPTYYTTQPTSQHRQHTPSS